MLCEKCKIREANIQYTEVINGVKTEHNFCAHCAKEMDFGQYSAIFDEDFPLAKLLSGLLGMEEPVQKRENYRQIICPTCHTGYEEFIENSRFGCADCYSVFDLLISDNMKQLQGSDSHTGKVPLHQKELPGDPLGSMIKKEHQTVDDEIKVWNIRLKEALKKEEYEAAAECRDKINELKEGK